MFKISDWHLSRQTSLPSQALPPLGPPMALALALPSLEVPPRLDLWIEVVSCRGFSWKMVVSWSLSHVIPCKNIYIVSCSLKWVIFLFHGSTDFMNSWQHDAVEFPLMNEERELGVSLGVDTTEGWMVSIFHEDWLNLFSTGILGKKKKKNGWSIPLYSFIAVASNHFID